MEKQPLVSVITITRNRSSLIGRALKSVIEQSYKNIEYLIYDGASTDNTKNVVQSFLDPRIRYVQLEENKPIVQTLWMAFEASKGDYIAFLDDDDEYLPQKIEKQVRLFEKLTPDYGLVYCWFNRINSLTGAVFNEHKYILRGDVHSEVVEKPILSGTPTLLFRRNVFEEMHGWRDDIGIVSDWELCARTCQKYKVDVVPEILVHCWENHGYNQMTHSRQYYQDANNKLIKFHSAFLSEFEDVFSKYPKKRIPHIKPLISLYFLVGKRKEAIKLYFRLLTMDFTVANLVIPFKCFIRKYLIK